MIRLLYNDGTRATELPVDGIADALEASGFFWLDLDNPTPEETNLLRKPLKFHPLAVEDCLHQTHFPKADDYGDYIYMVLHGAALPEGGKGRFQTVEIDFFVGKNFLVTHHTDASRSLAEVRDRLRKAGDTIPTVPQLLHAILDLQVTHYLEVIDAFDKEMEKLEEQVFKNPRPEVLTTLFSLRKDLMRFRRTLNPQREVIHRLARNEFRIIPQDQAMFFRDIYDHFFRVSEMVDTYRDTLTSALEGYLSVTSNRLNEIMKTLTLTSLIILPMSLVASIYGMNFAHMPELAWPYGYAFALGIMVAVGLGMWLYFRRKKWL